MAAQAVLPCSVLYMCTLCALTQQGCSALAFICQTYPPTCLAYNSWLCLQPAHSSVYLCVTVRPLVPLERSHVCPPRVQSEAACYLTCNNKVHVSPTLIWSMSYHLLKSIRRPPVSG
jgi:hypothetical protein